MKKIKMAVIGLGYWGPNIVRNLKKINNVEIAYCCDMNDNTFNKIDLGQTTKLTTNYNQVLNDNNVDAVIIATPLSSHFEIAKNALAKGKHVLVEKPFTKTSKQAKDLISLSRKYKKILMVGHTFIYSPAIKKIKNILSTNSFGSINYYDSTRINLGLIHNDLNVIWDLAPHDFSIISYITSNDPKSVYAFGASSLNKKNEEIAHILIRYNKNFNAHIYVSWLSPVKIRSMLIGGTKQFIKYNDIEPSEKITIYNKGIDFSKSQVTPFSPAYRSGDATIPYLDQIEALENELAHFAECIKNNTKPITDGTEGLRVVKLLEATDKSLKTRKEILL